MTNNQFDYAPCSEIQRIQNYSRFNELGHKESWEETVNRVLKSPQDGLFNLANYTEDQQELIYQYMIDKVCPSSGRLLWVGGTEWITKQTNYSGAYNCTSTVVDSFEAMAELMSLGMTGSGTGGVLEDHYISQLQPIVKRLNPVLVANIGAIKDPAKRSTQTSISIDYTTNRVNLTVGDSRQGWVDSYLYFLKLATNSNFQFGDTITVDIDLSNIRPKGEKLKGFGGIANPTELPLLWDKLAAIINDAFGRQLDALEVTLLIEYASDVYVAGNIRRSAGMKQYDSDKPNYKSNLYYQDESGNWKVDEKLLSLRLSNHTKVYHHKPTLEELQKSVTDQYFTGEGAIEYAPMAIARGNADILDDQIKIEGFIKAYEESPESAIEFLKRLDPEVDNLDHRLQRYGLNPCFAAGTMILTSEGYYPIEELVNKTVNVWDGDQWVEIDNFRITGENQPVYKLTLESNEEVYATPYHTFILEDGTRVELQNLKVGQRLKTHNQYPKNSQKINRSRNSHIVKSIEYSHVADKVYCCTVPTNHSVGLANGLMTGQCGEILGKDFFCNLSTVSLGLIDPFNHIQQFNAFKVAALQACSLLHHKFDNPKFQRSREIDPIIGVSFTQGFDFFARLFGVEWLEWWQAGRPDTPEGKKFKLAEAEILTFWKNIVFETVNDYCQRNNLKAPNRCTTLKPEGSLTLLTGTGCNGHHAPKGWQYIRRMTFDKNNPIALAAMDYGYSVVPGQKDVDDQGNLLTDPFDERCTQWLIEIPVKEQISSLIPEGVEIDPGKFSFKAQWDWYLQVQQHYVTHNTSATLELTEDEIFDVARCIYDAIQDDKGYISAALLQRFDPTTGVFPRLPFEPISTETYEELMSQVLERRKSDDFTALVNARLTGNNLPDEPAISACSDGLCALK